MSTLNNTTEGRESAPPESQMAEYKAGPRKRKPIHPGAIVKRQLEDLDLTIYAAAPQLGVTKQALGNLVACTAAVSPAMALRLGKFFGNGPELWMRLQADFDLWEAREKLAGELAAIKTVAKTLRA